MHACIDAWNNKPFARIHAIQFAEGFRSSDFTIMVMEHQEQLTHLFSKDLVAQLATSSLDYYPSTLAAYELLVIDQQVCDKAFFDAALDDMCSRFLSIPNEEIESMLEALGAQYPAALIDHFKLYIDKIREFCQNKHFAPKTKRKGYSQNESPDVKTKA